MQIRFTHILQEQCRSNTRQSTEKSGTSIVINQGSCRNHRCLTSEVEPKSNRNQFWRSGSSLALRRDFEPPRHQVNQISPTTSTLPARYLSAMASSSSQPQRVVHQDYIARIRYSNALPPPPNPPKLLDIPTSISQYTNPGFASRLARDQPLNIEADAELGMPLDLVGMPGIFDGDESCKFVAMPIAGRSSPLF